MRLSLDDIPNDGKDVELDLAQDWVRAAGETALEGRLIEARGGLHIDVRDGGDVMVTGSVAARCARACDRCGRDVEFAVDGPLELIYVPALQDGDEAQELASSELDHGIYEDGVVDLAIVVQEHLALQLSARLTCDDEGVIALEEGDCISPAAAALPAETVDPRFAILQSLKLDEPG